MRKNKGFTLIELLSIIVIMGVIIVLAGPSMTRQFKKEEENNSKILREKIHNATKLYVAKYHAPTLLNGGPISLTLSDLQNDGLINLQTNKNCKEKLSGKISVSVDTNGKVIYNYKSDDNIIACYGSVNSVITE